MQTLSYEKALKILQDNVSVKQLKRYYFPLNLLDKFSHTFNEEQWNVISYYQKLNEEFIRKFIDKLNGDRVSEKQCLSENVIRDFRDRLNWYYISKSQKLSKSFIKEFKDQLNWSMISIYQDYEERDFQSEFKKAGKKNHLKIILPYVDWKKISKNPQDLPEDFIIEFAEELNWIEISYAKKLSENLMRACHKQLFWPYISRCQTLSENFINQFSHKVDWYQICRYQKLSEEFIQKHSDKVYWDHISKYQKLSWDFVANHIDKLNKNKLLENEKINKETKELIKTTFKLSS